MEHRYPDLKTRIQSNFVDGILMIVVMFAIAYFLDKTNEDGETENGAMKAVIFVCIWGLYEPLSMTLGSTLGNYLMKIKVRKATDHTKRINIFQAYVRFIIKLLLGWISFLTIHSNNQRRAIHDLMSGSIMLEK